MIIWKCYITFLVLSLALASCVSVTNSILKLAYPSCVTGDAVIGIHFGASTGAGIIEPALVSYDESGMINITLAFLRFRQSLKVTYDLLGASDSVTVLTLASCNVTFPRSRCYGHWVNVLILILMLYLRPHPQTHTHGWI